MTTDTLNIDFGTIRFRLIRGLVRNFKPKEFYFVRIDNWFDSKWLNFSGKTLGTLPIWKGARNDNNIELTIPPFNPNRITGEGIFDRQNHATEDSCTYKLRKDVRSIHPRQPSSENLNRKIKHLTTDALFVWVSENTEANKFGCIMVYLIKDSEVMTFYLSLANKSEQEESDNWELHKVAGSNSKQISNYLNSGKTYKLRLDVD